MLAGANHVFCMHMGVHCFKSHDPFKCVYNRLEEIREENKELRWRYCELFLELLLWWTRFGLGKQLGYEVFKFLDSLEWCKIPCLRLVTMSCPSAYFTSNKNKMSLTFLCAWYIHCLGFLALSALVCSDTKTSMRGKPDSVENFPLFSNHVPLVWFWVNMIITDATVVFFFSM